MCVFNTFKSQRLFPKGESIKKGSWKQVVWKVRCLSTELCITCLFLFQEHRPNGAVVLGNTVAPSRIRSIWSLAEFAVNGFIRMFYSLQRMHIFIFNLILITHLTSLLACTRFNSGCPERIPLEPQDVTCFKHSLCRCSSVSQDEFMPA